jgi:RNA polymerase sigma-70 factor (ECF subfamily)
LDSAVIANHEDSDLISAVAGGDGAALMALYDRYNRQAFGLAFRILSDASTAEEVVQDAFMALWRNAKSFDTSRGGVKTWLLTIVHNRSIDRLRSAKSRGGTVELEVADYAGANTDPWDDVTTEIDGAQVRAAVAELPPDQRTAVEMAYFQGLTHQEISERTNIPLGTVKGRLRLGLKKLSTSLASSYYPGGDAGLPGDRAGPART